MHSFARVGGGFESLLEVGERRLLAQVVADVAEVVAGRDDEDHPAQDVFVDDPTDLPPFAVGAATGGREDPGDLSDLSCLGELGEKERAQRILGALDFDAATEARWTSFDDPALERLVPLSSRGDAEAADEFRRYTQRDLRDEKAGRLMVVEQELLVPTGQYGAVRIEGAEVGLWLAALTDVRLVLASRLGLEDDADADRVHALAEGLDVPARDLPPSVADEDTERLMAGLYTALSWWQESLLAGLEA